MSKVWSEMTAAELAEVADALAGNAYHKDSPIHLLAFLARRVALLENDLKAELDASGNVQERK